MPTRSPQPSTESQYLPQLTAITQAIGRAQVSTSAQRLQIAIGSACLHNICEGIMRIIIMSQRVDRVRSRQLQRVQAGIWDWSCWQLEDQRIVAALYLGLILIIEWVLWSITDSYLQLQQSQHHHQLHHKIIHELMINNKQIYRLNKFNSFFIILQKETHRAQNAQASRIGNTDWGKQSSKGKRRQQSNSIINNIINQIFLISLVVVLLKKIKFIIKSNARRYYVFVIFYIVSKLALCVFLQIKIIYGIPDEFKELDTANVEKIFQNSLIFADCAIIELFLIALQHYLVMSFSIFGNRKTQRLIRILLQGTQLVVFFTIMIPLLLFNIQIIHYYTLNIFTMSVNCLNVIVFIAAFFFMNFKMTGLMMDQRSTQMIKKVYKLLFGLLISRLIMSFLQVWIQVNISNGSFSDFISILQQHQDRIVVLGLCFIAYLLIVLLTQGLPLILSLRQSLVIALAQVIKPRSRPSSFDQSMITSDVNIREQLLNNMDIIQQQDFSPQTPRATIKSAIQSDQNNLIKLQNPQELIAVEKILTVRDDYVIYKAKWTKNNKFFFVKKLGNISNYIIQQMMNQIQNNKKLQLKIFNPMKVLQNTNQKNQNQIYLVQKFLNENLKIKMQKIAPQNIKQKIQLSIKIAKAIHQFHENVKTGHGVLNPKNIMFDDDGNVILTGHGMESLKKYLSLTSQYSNISFYTAPELFSSNRQKTVSKPSKSADIYSFGIIFYEIITGNYKYRSLSLPEIRKKFIVENSRPKISQDINQDFKQIMRKCWQENPENRLQIKWLITNLQTIRQKN